MLKYTVTYCNLLEHTLKYRHILSHNEIVCNIPKHTVKYRHTLYHTEILYCYTLKYTLTYLNIL